MRLVPSALPQLGAKGRPTSPAQHRVQSPTRIPLEVQLCLAARMGHLGGDRLPLVKSWVPLPRFRGGLLSVAKPCLPRLFRSPARLGALIIKPVVALHNPRSEEISGSLHSCVNVGALRYPGGR